MVKAVTLLKAYVSQHVEAMKISKNNSNNLIAMVMVRLGSSYGDRNFSLLKFLTQSLFQTRASGCRRGRDRFWGQVLT
ncbi:MAG: hypothetical protein A3I05_04295 [Deltaproteobacteria bacterium RIFCSPLOWO2_02_FULL_44_10]|nr:MAG: hypothetical protein A3C46_07110 [Deltaproteobacteria bacterium RIFCSPHIGHO2_02_FULL_44_16]OGQ46585.1 MAG: hypothetical protein A3I05_04295 [Deltaproteobacteria bacterium RIFCSPLOWO2_02_FULL_44_10]